jgi:hypothetical protein
METPEVINARPVPCDLAREHCAKIFESRRLETHFDHVELMVLAYRMGGAMARAQAFRDAVDIITRPIIKHELDRDAETKDRSYGMSGDSAYDVTANDRRALAREVNSGITASRMRDE